MAVQFCLLDLAAGFVPQPFRAVRPNRPVYLPHPRWTASRITVLNHLADLSLEGLTFESRVADSLVTRPCCRVKTIVAANTGCYAVVGSWMVAHGLIRE